MRKLSKKKRQELIGRIMDDVSSNMYQYEDFILDCAKEVIEKWSDKDLLDWTGEREYL